MKISSGWVITCFFVFVVLFLTVTPFDKMVDADNYIGTRIYYELHTCLN